MQYIEYLTTDAKCWFDTGIIPDVDTKIEISLAPLVWSSFDIPEKNWNAFIGAQNSDDSNSTFQIRRNNSYNRWSVRVGNGTSQNSSQNYTTGQTYTLTLDSTYFSIDGVNYSVGTSSMDTCNYTLFISAVNNGETNSSWSYHRAAAATFYYVKVWKNNVLVGEFLPAIDNNNIGFYDTVSQTFKANLGTGTPIAGPILSSIVATPSSTSIKASGGTVSIEVSTDNAWTLSTSGDSFLTFSSTGDTSGATITATASSYTGATDMLEYLTFTDSITGDIAELTVKQRKHVNGQPLYLGVDTIYEMFLGLDGIAEAYLGEDLVFSTGPFQGLKIIPKALSFMDGDTVKTVKVKSSEPWDMTIPAWITADTLSGDTGETIVTLTASTQTAETSGNVVVTSTTYSASASVEYLFGTPYLDVVGRLGIATDFYVGQFYRTDRYIKLEVAAKGSATTTSQTYLYETNPVSPWFSMESFTTGNSAYVNMASTTGAFAGSVGGNGLDHPWTITVDMETGYSVIDGVITQTRVISGNWPADGVPLIFFGTYSTNSRTRFYYMKIWDRSGNLVKHFVPDPSGSIKDLVSGTIYTITSGGTSTYGLEIA